VKTKNIVNCLRVIVCCVALSTVDDAEAGQPVEAWIKHYGAVLNDDASDLATKIAVDNLGNVVVAGYQTTGLPGSDIVLVKYTSNGLPLWTNSYSGPGNTEERINGLVVDSSGTIS
jgi:hypothetical protein